MRVFANERELYCLFATGKHFPNITWLHKDTAMQAQYAQGQCAVAASPTGRGSDGSKPPTDRKSWDDQVLLGSGGFADGHGDGSSSRQTIHSSSSSISSGDDPANASFGAGVADPAAVALADLVCAVEQKGN